MRRPLFLDSRGTAFLLILALSSCSPEARQARHLERGDRYFKAGDYEKAKIEYMGVLRTDSRNALTFKRLGFMWFEEGAPFRAAPFLLKAQELAPDDLDNRLVLARALVSLGRVADGRKETIAILEQSPAHGEAIVLLADTDQTREDIKYTDEQVQKFPERDNIFFNLASANISVQKAEFAAAEIFLRRALALDPQSPLPHLAMANFCLIQKDFPGVDRELKAAAELSGARSNSRLKYAEFKAQRGAADEARALLRDITKAAPDYLPAWRFLGQIALTQRKYDEALMLLENVFVRDPKNAEARILQAQAWLGKGDTKKAVEGLEDLAKTYSNVPAINYELGRAYFRNKNTAQAAVVLNQAIAAKPDYPEAILLLGEIDLQTGNPALAVSAMTELLRKRPHLPPAELLLTEAYLSLGRPNEAAAVVRREIEFSPEAPDPYYRLGLILHQEHKDEEARIAFEKVLELTPGNLMAINQLVDLDISKKDFDSAMRRVELQLGSKPPPAVAYFMQGKTYLAQGRSDQAEASLLKALELDSNSLGTYELLISTYLAAKKLPEAVHQLQTLLSKNPNESRALMTLATTYERMGDFSKARDAYERLLSLDPNSVTVLASLASLYAEKLNRTDRGLELANKARTLEPLNPRIAHTLGWILYRLGNYQDALGMIREAADKLPNQPDIQFHLGMANYMMNQPDAARTAFKNAVESVIDFPTREEARRWLGFLEDDSANKLSIDQLNVLVEQRPNDLVARMRLAALFEQQGAADKAALHYEHALNVNPKLKEALLKLAQIYAGPLHNIDKAVELGKAAREMDANDPRTAAVLGNIVYQTGNYGWAYSLLQESAQKETVDLATLEHYAWTAYALGRVAEARHLMQRLSARAPRTRWSEEAKSFLALTSVDNSARSLKAAQPQVEKILQADPQYVPALMVQVSSQIERGDTQAAIATCGKILQRFPDFAPAQKRLASLYAEQPNALDTAYELAAKARKALPDDPEVAQTLGELSYRKKEFAYALQLLKESAKSGTIDARRLYYLGMCYLALQERREGQNALERSLTAGLQEPLASEARRVLVDLRKEKES